MAKKEKAPKAAKATKESKAGAGGANFFQLHVEKIALGAVVLVMAYLVYDGMGTKGVPDNKNPENLTQTASSTLSSIKESHWKEMEIQPERQFKKEFEALVKDSHSPTFDKPYETDPWEIAPRSISEKRGDPALLAPINLQVKTGYGALAIKVKADVVDPFADFDPADEIKSKRRPPRNSGRSGGRGAGAGGAGGSSGLLPGGGDMGDMGDMGGGSDLGGLVGSGPMGGVGAGGARRLFPQYDRGFGTPNSQGGGMMGPMGSGPMGGGGDDMGDLGSPDMGGGRGLGGSGIGTPGGFGGGATGKGEKLGYKSVYFNVVSGVAPHKEIVKEYKKAFEDSAGFNVMRDRPNYLSFIAERVDVTADPAKEPAEGDWKKVADLRQQEKLMADWAGTNPEIANFLYTDPELTLAPLPLLIRDYRSLVTHPDVPVSGKPLAALNPADEQGKGEEEESSDESEEDQFSSRRRSNQGNMMQGSGGMGMPTPGGGSGGMGMPTPGGGSGGMGMPTPGGGRGAMGGGMGAMGGGMMDGGDMEGSGGMGMGGSGMPFGGNLFGGSTTTIEAESDYKLIRFYDFDIKPGHVYRYRIRLVVEDPNYPEDRSLDLDLSILKNEVFARVAAQRAEDEKKAANKDGVKPRTFYRFTDWSQPSPPAYAPNPGLFANGEVTVSKRTMNLTSADNKPVTIEVDTSARGHLGNVVFADWDSTLGVDVPTIYEAQKGTLLFYSTRDKEPEIVDPVTKLVKKLKGYKMNDAIAVVDVRGGENLAHNDDRLDRLTFSGEMLLFRNDGSLAVSDELDDQDDFRMFTFADEKEQAEKAAAPPAGGGVGSPMGGGGDMGLPGGGGREGGR